MRRDLDWYAAVFWSHLPRAIGRQMVLDLMQIFGGSASSGRLHGVTARSAARGMDGIRRAPSVFR